MQDKYRIGIDLGGTYIKAGVVNSENKLVSTYKCPTLVSRPWQEVVNDMAGAAKAALESAGLSLSDCVSVGIGSPGIVDARKGTVVFSSNFHNWIDVPVCETLSKLLDLPAKASNDANCAALGEFVAGTAKGYDSVVLLTLGTGVGGGVIYEGKIFEGSAPGGAEFGHISLHAGGKPCGCGRKGCIESYCSATALVRDAKEAMLAHNDSKLYELCRGNADNMNGKIPFIAMRMGDKYAKEIVDNYILDLSEAIVSLINIFRPEIVLISGGISGEGTALTDPINTFVKKYAYAGDKARIPTVSCAKLGNSAGIVGAANL